MQGKLMAEKKSDFAGVQYMFVGDARKITGEKILETLGLEPGDIHCVIGSPPCQGFSKANRNRGPMDSRNSLVFDFARLVCEIQPLTVIMENVPDIINMLTQEGIPVIDAFCKILADGRYGDYETLRKTLLSTSGAGALLKGKPHKRKQNSNRKSKNENRKLF